MTPGRGEINHGQRCHLWTATDFRHHQGDIWNDENGLGIEFVTIVVWFRMLLSLNGNENQSTYRHKLKFILIILATDKFRFICWKNGWMMIFFCNMGLYICWLTHFDWRRKRFLKISTQQSICDNFSWVVILKSIKSCSTLYTWSNPRLDCKNLHATNNCEREIKVNTHTQAKNSLLLQTFWCNLTVYKANWFKIYSVSI